MKRMRNKVILAMSLATAIAVLALLSSCTIGLPRDADLIFSSHSDNGIISRTYSNAALYPDHVVALPSRDVADEYAMYSEYSRLSSLPKDVISSRVYDVSLSNGDFSLSKTSDSYKTDRAEYSPEEIELDSKVVGDLINRIDSGQVKSSYSSGEWAGHSNKLEAVVWAVGGYEVLQISDNETTPGGLVRMYADGMVYHGVDLIGHYDTYGIDSYDSFIRDGVID